MKPLRMFMVMLAASLSLVFLAPAFPAEPEDALFQAALSGDLSQVTQLLNRGANVNATDTEGNSALMMACLLGRTEIVKLLLANGANVHVRQQQGVSALWLASVGGRPTVVKALLQHGADVNGTDINGTTVLMAACSSNNPRVVELILQQGADVSLRNRDGKTALDIASEGGNYESVSLLKSRLTGTTEVDSRINGGAETVDQTDSEPTTKTSERIKSRDATPRGGDSVDNSRKPTDVVDAEALFKRGVRYEHGIDVKRDRAEAIKWYYKATQAGSADAKKALDRLLRTVRQPASSSKNGAEIGGEITDLSPPAPTNSHEETDYAGVLSALSKRLGESDELAQEEAKELYESPNARVWILEAARKGNAEARFHLSRMYLFGIGLQKDPATAAKWCRLAAEQGQAPAQSNLGWLYHHGVGVKQDSREALKWFFKAAKQGFAIAQGNVAKMYLDGDGTPKNYRNAFYWYRRAADQGHAASQHGLGYMYLEGLGVNKSKAEAIRWYTKAAGGGFKRAQDALNSLK